MPDTNPREPPHSEEAETAVLGAILLDNKLLPQARKVVRDPAEFYSPRHGIVYTHMLKLAEAGQPPDFVTLSDSIRNAGELDQIGGASWISWLTDQVPRLPNIEAYAHTISNTARQRRAIRTFTEAIDLLHQTGDLETTLNLTTDALDIIRRGGTDPQGGRQPLGRREGRAARADSDGRRQRRLRLDRWECLPVVRRGRHCQKRPGLEPGGWHRALGPQRTRRDLRPV